jgi:protein TonB
VRLPLYLAGALSILAHWALSQVEWPHRAPEAGPMPARELEVSIMRLGPGKPAEKPPPAFMPPELEPRLQPQPHPKANSQPEPVVKMEPAVREENEPASKPALQPKPSPEPEVKSSHQHRPQPPISLEQRPSPAADMPSHAGPQNPVSASSPSDQMQDAASLKEQPASQSSLGQAGRELSLQEAIPRYDINPPPPYPETARRRAYEGTVLLQVRVRKDGRVGEVRVNKTSGYEILDQAALEAVSSWVFVPGRRGDEAVDMDVRVPVTFKLR